MRLPPLPVSPHAEGEPRCNLVRLMCCVCVSVRVCAVSSRSIVEISPVASTRRARDARADAHRRERIPTTHPWVLCDRVHGDGDATSDARPRTRLVASIRVASSSLTRRSPIARASRRRGRTRASFFSFSRVAARPRRGASRARRGVSTSPVGRFVSGASRAMARCLGHVGARPRSDGRMDVTHRGRDAVAT